MPRRVLRKAQSGLAGRYWIVALAAAKCFTVGLVMVALPVKLDRLGWSDSWLGLLWCVNAASYTATCVLYSFAVHRVPLRRVMAGSCVLSALSAVGLHVCQARGAMFALGTCWSVTSALFWPSLMAWIGEGDDERLAGDISVFNFSWTASLTVGFVVGGQLEALLSGLCFHVVGVASVALACIIPFAHIRGKQATSGTRVPHPTARMLPRRFMAAGWVATFVVTLCVGVPGAIFVKLNSALGYGPQELGMFFGLRGGVQAVMMVVLGAFQGWRLRRWPLVLCLVCSGLGSVLLAVAGTKCAFALGFVLLGVGVAMGYTMGFYYSVHGRRNRKRNASFFEGLIASQSIVGGPMGGALASGFGRRVPYAVLAALAGVAALVQWALLRRAPERLRAMQETPQDDDEAL